MRKPLVGQIVHYYPQGYSVSIQPLAAIIAHVNNFQNVNISYFNEQGIHAHAMYVYVAQYEEDMPAFAHIR